mmetsp:Transcript_33305/g.60001  ORF Transcript_33305/g.60001 Transcript_33305/m.60001 type:complete len:443 (-) Transcript_33305:127-1455(-)
MRPNRGKKAFGSKRVLLLFGASAIISIASLLIHNHQLVRYAYSQTTMVLVEQPFLPKPEGLEHSNFTFPSVQDRVRYYMGSWYDNNHDDHYYNGTPAINHYVCRDIPVFSPENKRPINDQPFMFDETTLRTMRLKRWTNLETSTYEHDSLKYFYWDPTNNNNSSRGITRTSRHDKNHKGKGRRIIFQYGDGMVSGLQTQHPIMVKARNAAATSTSDNSTNDDRKPTAIIPILALINEYRHYGGMSGVRQYFPWEEKKDVVVFRGVSTGNRLGRLRPFIAASHSKGGDSATDYDFAFTKIIQKQIPVNDTANLMGHLLTSKELTRYKYLLVLPGNDVSSGLKWMLYSDSVVIMPHPQKVSWAMEDQLVPYVHYIPVQEDLSDLQSQLQWAREHDELCRDISKHATQYMIHLYVSQKAQEDNNEIRHLIAERYQILYGPIIDQC